MASPNKAHTKKIADSLSSLRGCDPEVEFLVVEKEQTHSRIIDNGDCTYTHISGNGVATLIETDNNFNLIDNCDGLITFSWKDHDPVVVDICKIVGDNCNATLTVNPDGTLTFTDNTGTVTNTLPLPSSQFIDNGDGTLTHIAGDGAVTVVDLCGLVSANCTDQLVDNGNDTFTHVALDGTVTVIPLYRSSLVNNGNNTYTHFDGAGNSTLIDINELDRDINDAVLNGSVLTLTSEDGNTIDIDICAVVATNCNASLVENIDGSWTFTDNAGVSTTSTVPTGSTLVDNGNGTATHQTEDGVITTLDICQMLIDGGCDNTDSLVDNGNGTYTHTATDGTVTIIDVNGRPASDIVDNGDGTFTHTNGDGVITLLDVCQSVAANCNATIVVNPDGSFTHTDNAGLVTTVGPLVSGGTVLTAAAPLVTSNGVSVAIGENYIEFPDLTTWASEAGTIQIAALPGVTTNGAPLSPGSFFIQFPNGDTWGTVDGPREMYLPGEVLPNTMVGSVTVMLDDGSTSTIGPGVALPINTLGRVFVDEASDVPTCVDGPQLADTRNLPFQAQQALTDVTSGAIAHGTTLVTVSQVITNPDPKHPAVADLNWSFESQIDGVNDGEPFAILADFYVDNGDGALNLELTGVAHTIGSSPATASPGVPISNYICQRSVTLPSAIIPPLGSITVRAATSFELSAAQAALAATHSAAGARTVNVCYPGTLRTGFAV